MLVQRGNRSTLIMSYRAGESLVGLGAPRAHYIAWPGALCCREGGEACEASKRVLHGVCYCDCDDRVVQSCRVGYGGLCGCP